MKQGSTTYNQKATIYRNGLLLVALILVIGLSGCGGPEAKARRVVEHWRETLGDIEYRESWQYLHPNYQFAEFRDLDNYVIWCDEQYRDRTLGDYIGGALVHGPTPIGDGGFVLAYAERRRGPYTVFTVQPVGKEMLIADIEANALTFENQ